VVNATTIALADSRANALQGVTLALDPSVAVGTTHAIGVPFAATPAVDAGADTIRFGGAHAFHDGQAVVYDNGGGANIGGLTDNNGATRYYVKVIDATRIALYSDAALTRAVDLLPALATGAGHTLADAAAGLGGGSLNAVGRTTVKATSEGQVITATLAAAKTDDAPSAKADANAAQAAGGQKYGRAVSGSVSVNLLSERTVASIQNAVVSRSGGVTVTAINTTDDTALSGAAALSTNRNGSLGLAGAVTVNLLDSETRAHVTNAAMSNVGALSLNASASGDILAIAAGLAGSARGIGMAGSIAFNTLTTDTDARIDGGSVVSGSSVSVVAADQTGITAVAGALAYGGKAGFGAGIAINRIDGGAQASISGGDVDVTGALVITASNNARITSVGAGIAVASATVPAGTKARGLAAAVGVSVNTLDTQTLAFIAGTGSNTLTAGSVALTATDASKISGIAGGLAIGLALGNQGSATAAAAGASFVYNNLDHRVAAYADDAAFTAAGAVSLSASETGSVYALSIGGAVALADGSGMGSSIGVSGAGAVAVNTLRGGAETRLRKSRVSTTGTGNVSLSASDSATLTADAGGAAFSVALTEGSGSATGASVGAALAFNRIKGGLVRALVDDSMVDAAGDITLQATSTATIDALTLAGAGAAGGSTGGGGYAASGAGAYSENTINRVVEARLRDSGITTAEPGQTLRARGKLVVTASDTSTVNAKTYGFSIGVGASTGTGNGGALSVGVSLAYNTVDTDVEASIQNSQVVTTTGGTALSATSASTITAMSVAASVAAGYSSSSNALALSGGGADARNTVLGKTNAFASGSQLASAGDVTLAASSSSRIDATVVAASLSAALAPAKTAGSASVGAARARNLIGWSDNSTEQPLEVRAYLLDTSVTAPNGALKLSADAHQQIAATVGAASVAVTSGRNAIGLGGAGAESVNRISEQVAATLDGSAAGGVLARSVSLKATDRSTIDADAGAAAIVAAISGSAGVALSVGVALAENRIDNRVTAGVGRATLTTTAGDLVVSAGTTATIAATSRAAAVGFASGRAGVAVSGAGALAKNIILSRTVAEIDQGAIVVSAGKVDLDAASSGTITATIAAASGSVGVGSSAGIGASVGFALARNFIGWDPSAAPAAYDSNAALASIANGATVHVLDGVRAGDVYRYIGAAPALVYDLSSASGSQSLSNTKDVQTRVKSGGNVYVWRGSNDTTVNLATTNYGDTSQWRLERLASLAGQDFGDADSGSWCCPVAPTPRRRCRRASSTRASPPPAT
jgi:hypothetical protein